MCRLCFHSMRLLRVTAIIIGLPAAALGCRAGAAGRPRRPEQAGRDPDRAPRPNGQRDQAAARGRPHAGCPAAAGQQHARHQAAGAPAGAQCGAGRRSPQVALSSNAKPVHKLLTCNRLCLWPSFMLRLRTIDMSQCRRRPPDTRSQRGGDVISSLSRALRFREHDRGANSWGCGTFQPDEENDCRRDDLRGRRRGPVLSVRPDCGEDVFSGVCLPCVAVCRGERGQRAGGLQPLL